MSRNDVLVLVDSFALSDVDVVEGKKFRGRRCLFILVVAAFAITRLAQHVSGPPYHSPFSSYLGHPPKKGRRDSPRYSPRNFSLYCGQLGQ